MPLRIDVTEIVRYLKQHPRGDYGIALKAGSGSDLGVSYSTGSSGGVAPKLELYFW